MALPRPASGVTIYVMYAYGKVTITVCPCWPVCQYNNQSHSSLVTLTFDLLTLKAVPILVFLGLSVLNLGPMYATDRQTSDSIIA